MAKGPAVDLSAEQQRELEEVRDHHAKPYMRVKAAAILKVAAGQSRRQVAQHGLLKPVVEETVSHWLKRYQEQGLAGLRVQSGRGRKPAFSPVEHPRDLEEVVAQVEHVIHHAPCLLGLERSRWWLAGLQKAVAWCEDLSLPGIWQILQRLDIHYKQGCRSLHSPDADYDRKLALVRQAQGWAATQPRRIILLYEDEMSYYRKPGVGRDYDGSGSAGPLAPQGTGFNTSRRIAGCLDAWSGQVWCWQRNQFDHATFLRYLLEVEGCYPEAERIWIALDNWPVHHHPEVLARLAKSKLSLLYLPTYAPWTNPIEKVWRKLRQEILLQHRHTDQWSVLQERVEEWLGQYRSPSPSLLQYVGLLPPTSKLSAYPS
jgi:transposase